MSDVAIRVEGLTKTYRIGAPEARREGWAGAIGDRLAAPFEYLRSMRRPPTEAETLHALRDVSFEVRAGEVLGIIGRNGAGKSTLLKILSRITEPTSGRAELHGRVGSLLEVGTGFHPELTGRENIYLNGAILGMRRAEIDRKFDEIVDFSGVERFLDTPVKRYSSGMYVRLAFAVAAHLEPEILLVDEVLAVGDMEFQKRCIGRLNEAAHEGRAIVFVSHDLDAVSRLCSRVLVLHSGSIDFSGLASDGLERYVQSEVPTPTSREWTGERPGSDAVRLTSAAIRSGGEAIQTSVDIRRPIEIELEYEVFKETEPIVPNLHFYNSHGVCMFCSLDFHSVRVGELQTPGRYRRRVTIPGNSLAPGLLAVHIGLTTLVPWRIHLYLEDGIAVHIHESDALDTVRGEYMGHLPGVVRPMLEWETC